MSNPAGRSARPSLDDIASSPQLAEVTRLLRALRHRLGPSLRDLPGGEHGPAAQQLRRQTRSMPTSALRASVQQALQLLERRPPVDPQAWAASRCRLGTIMSQRAVEDDWIARLQARRRCLGSLGDVAASRTLDADLRVRKQQRRRLINQERLAERIVAEHECCSRALCDWRLEHLPQLVQARWYAQALLERQERALDEVMVSPPPYLLAALGAPPRSSGARQVWRQGALAILAILRFRTDHHIQDPDRALGDPAVGTCQRLRRGQVEVIVDQARQLLQQPGEPFPGGEPFTGPDLGLP